LLGFIIAWVIVVGRHTRLASPGHRLCSWRWWPLALVLLQAALGIFTVLQGAQQTVAGRFGGFEMLALMHQLVATGLLMSLVACLYLMRSKATA
jgi:hypothetical protein